MTPNYDAIRVAFATGNPVAARDDLLPAVADKYRDLKTDQLADEFFQLTLADRGVNLPETERKQ